VREKREKQHLDDKWLSLLAGVIFCGTSIKAADKKDAGRE
jgi:hypothetical protein